MMTSWQCGGWHSISVACCTGSLRPRYRTGLLSNSGDGARREEQARYAFEGLFEVIIYSHEVGLARPDHKVYALNGTARARRAGLPRQSPARGAPDAAPQAPP
jgi:hypothetical protein